jgi:hypothetical protein
MCLGTGLPNLYRGYIFYLVSLLPRWHYLTLGGIFLSLGGYILSLVDIRFYPWWILKAKVAGFRHFMRVLL